MSDAETFTLEAPGAQITYDVRRNDASEHPVLVMVGSPMGAAGFTTQAGHFTDRTVVTYDPRGVERSPRTDNADETTPEEHADDIRRIVTALGTGPVDLLASSGGAVNALVLVAQSPELVSTLVAHEPPAASAVPDREYAMAACHDIRATYLTSGSGHAMAKFIGIVTHKGELTAEYAAQPAPDPAMFGLPTVDDGSRNDALLGQNIVTCCCYEHDYEALKQASTRVVIAAGETSEGELANRAAHAVAARLGTEAVVFPSDHGGFLGGEYGQTGDPDAFAAKLREVLDA